VHCAAHALDLGRRFLESLHGAGVVTAASADPCTRVQDVGQQRRQVELSGDTGRGRQLGFGRVHLPLVERDTREQMAARRRVHGPVVKHGKRCVDQPFRIRDVPPGRGQLRPDEVEPGPGRVVAELVESAGRGGQRRLRIAETLELHERPPEAGSGPGGFQGLPRLVQLGQRRFVLLQGIGGQPQDADGLGLLGEQPGQVTGGTRGLETSSGALEVVDRLVQHPETRGEVGEVAFGHRGGHRRVDLLEVGEGGLEGRPGSAEVVEGQERLAPVVVHEADGVRRVAQLRPGVLEVLHGPGRLVASLVDDAEVDLGPGGELPLTGPFEGGQRRFAGPDRVGEPAKLSQRLH
jgi:hypothetical protein